MNELSLRKRLGPWWKRRKMARLLASSWRRKADLIDRYPQAAHDFDNIPSSVLRERARQVERWPYDWQKYGEQDAVVETFPKPEDDEDTLR